MNPRELRITVEITVTPPDDAFEQYRRTPLAFSDRLHSALREGFPYLRGEEITVTPVDLDQCRADELSAAEWLVKDRPTVLAALRSIQARRRKLCAAVAKRAAAAAALLVIGCSSGAPFQFSPPVPGDAASEVVDSGASEGAAVVSSDGGPGRVQDAAPPPHHERDAGHPKPPPPLDAGPVLRCVPCAPAPPEGCCWMKVPR